MVTEIGDAGDGAAVTMKVALPPSVLALPALTLISGTSLSETATVAVPWLAETV